MYRSLLLFILITIVGCNRGIYVRDGVTDGDTFNLATQALVDDDPVLQSWVAYSLARSACQLEIGGDNPARATTYGCEFSARQYLLDAWEEQRYEHAGIADGYLDTLQRVREAGFLDEYTVVYFLENHWQVPVEVDTEAFAAWRRTNLQRHKAETRLVGSWGFAEQQ